MRLLPAREVTLPGIVEDTCTGFWIHPVDQCVVAAAGPSKTRCCRSRASSTAARNPTGAECLLCLSALRTVRPEVLLTFRPIRSSHSCAVPLQRHTAQVLGHRFEHSIAMEDSNRLQDVRECHCAEVGVLFSRECPPLPAGQALRPGAWPAKAVRSPREVADWRLASPQTMPERPRWMVGPRPGPAASISGYASYCVFDGHYQWSVGLGTSFAGKCTTVVRTITLQLFTRSQYAELYKSCTRLYNLPRV
eukprot:COSAG06_NODE_2963_length_6022_cov_26.947315_6_plen_249_part_00